MVSSLALRTAYFMGVFLSLFLFQTQGWSYITASFGVSFAFVGMIMVVAAKGWVLNINLYTIGLAALSLWLCVNTALSVVPAQSLQVLTGFIILPLLLLVVSGFKDKIINDTMIWHILVGIGALTACYALFQFYSGTGRFDHIANFPFYNPNSLGLFLGIGGLILFHSFINTIQKSWKILYGVCVVIIFAGIITTASKAVMIGFVIASCVMVGLSKPLWRKNIIWCLGLGIFLIVTPFIMAIPSQTTNGDMIAQNLSLNPQTTMKRIPIWQGAMDTAINERPIIGTGFGTYKDVYLQYKRDGDPSAGLHAHNDILHLWIEVGAIGLMLIGFIIFVILKAWSKTPHAHIMQFTVLFFCAGMAMVTPIILLPPLLMIVALAVMPIMRGVTGRAIDSPFLKNGLIVLLLLLALVSVKNVAEDYKMLQVREALHDGDFDAMRAHVNDLDVISLGLHPSVPVYRASLILAFMEQGIIDPSQNQAALDEMQSYVDDGVSRNPYNPENIYYQAMLEEKKGNLSKAKSLWRKTLDIDPSYLGARIKLMQHARDDVEMLSLIETGLPIKYWKQDPKNFYSVALVFAKETKNKDLYAIVSGYLQKRLQLR